MSIPGGPSAGDSKAKDDTKKVAASDSKSSAGSGGASASAAALSTDGVKPAATAKAGFDSRLPLAGCTARLCGQSLYSDVTFIVGKSQDVKIPAHRFILAARSPAFEAMLFHPVRPLTKLTRSISIKDVEPEPFMCMLRSIYSDKPGLTHDTIAGAAFAAKRYQVECLRAACVHFSKRGITANTACTLYERSPELALAYIEENIQKVMRTPGWLALSERSLCSLLRSNKLDVDEPKLFKAVLKWAAAECERQKKDASKPDVLREVLKQVILLIRFPLFTTEQISLHVTKANLLTPEQLLGVFSYLGGNKQAKCVFSTVIREGAVLKLSFDADRKSHTVNLANNNLTASVYGKGGGWVLGNRVMKRGVHAWRLSFQSLAGNQYVTFGVSAQKPYFDQRSSFTDNSVYAIDTIQQTHQAGVVQGNTYMPITQAQVIDIQLDVDRGSLSFVNCTTKQQYQMANLVKPAEGFVPHFHLNRTGTSIRVVSIKPAQFGKNDGGGNNY